jgi:sortase (surface protein transpeptidase)
MKTPFSKFLFIASFVLLLLSSVRSNNEVSLSSSSSHQRQLNDYSSKEIIAMAEKNIQKRKDKSAQPEDGTFKFPNVFDALRFIF